MKSKGKREISLLLTTANYGNKKDSIGDSMNGGFGLQRWWWRTESHNGGEKMNKSTMTV